MATRSHPKNFPRDHQTSRRHPEPDSQVLKATTPGVFPDFGSKSKESSQTGLVSTKRIPPNSEKYYPEWKNSNTKSNKVAESERLAAEKLLQETKELIAETKQRAKQESKEVDAKFKQRVGDIAFWKSELESKLAELKDTVDELGSVQGRVEHALEACKQPLQVSEECLAHRHQRQGSDRVDDNVQKHLQLEIETLKNSQILLRQTLLQVNEELRQLNRKKHLVEKDLADKEAAIHIDDESSKLKVSRPHKRETNLTKYSVEKTGNVFTPADWQEYTENNLENATVQMKSTVTLVSSVDGILAHISSHLKSQFDLTERAFDRRIKEVKEAKKLLEEQLSETIVKINEIEESIIELEKAINAKTGPLATCQMKIQQRKKRPNVELVFDDVDVHLHNEAQTLIDGINKLEGHLAKSRACFASLQKLRLELESQINVKSNSIYIDEVKCKTLRQGVSINSY